MRVAELASVLALAVTTVGVIIWRMRVWATAHALTDRLTGVKNRRYVEQTMDRDAASCLRRYADWLALKLAPQNSDLSFLVVHLDDLETAARQFGAKTRDRLLIEIAHCLETTCRDSDLVARWSDVRFVVVGRFTNGTQTALLAGRVRRAVAGRVVGTSGRKVTTTCSIGYAVYPFDAKRSPIGWREVLALAEHAADDAMHSGGNRAVGYVAGSEPLRVSVAEVTERDTGEWLATGRLRREAAAG